MDKYELTEKEMAMKNISLLKSNMYSSEQRKYLIQIMPSIIETMIRINETDDNLVYDDLFHAICLKKLSLLE